ncbi:hypothetical protein CJF42_18955 [Pseudoalteromonas sp. NBT06-2]|uniref:tyrosine-type recombinase/integrase n=1 Tax=Pseudoalteromonas sp. NBT06-2 TaxID=2025950 RepID=UPI000BA5B8FE|nr:hypothetical protein CJF42_18955 [Pseudoalteromonas sp. NBT06-2]
MIKTLSALLEFQVTSTYISEGFSKIRDQLGLYSDIDKKARPTFHEIRRIAAQELMDSGHNPMSRMAHSNQATTNIYTDKHNIEWIEVSPVAINI